MELGKEAWFKVSALAISTCWKHVGLTGKIGPGLPVDRPSDPIPTFGPGAEHYRHQSEQGRQNPDLFFVSNAACSEISTLFDFFSLCIILNIYLLIFCLRLA